MVTQREEALGRAATDQDIEPVTRLLMELSGSYNAEDYAKASQLNHMTGYILGRCHEQYDLILHHS